MIQVLSVGLNLRSLVWSYIASFKVNVLQFQGSRFQTLSFIFKVLVFMLKVDDSIVTELLNKLGGLEPSC